MSSKIEWTERTWNPIAGCTAKSEGCTNCYAINMARRLEAMGVEKYQGLTRKSGNKHVWTGQINFDDEKALLEPLKRKKPTTYFVNSMSDLFNETVPFEVVDKIFAVMALCPQHTFQVLTKRPERMKEYFGQLRHDNTVDDWFGSTIFIYEEMEKLVETCAVPRLPLTNVWLGVTVEKPDHLDRLNLLRSTPAAIRWFSYEPALADLGEVDLSRIDWVVAGGETGHGAHPMHPDWASNIQQQCEAASVPFLFKQWGDWYPSDDEDPPTFKAKHVHLGNGIWAYRLGKKASGRKLNGTEYDQYPQTQTTNRKEKPQ